MGTTRTWVDNRAAALSAGAIGIALVAATVSAATHGSDSGAQAPTADAAMVASKSGNGTQPESATTAPVESSSPAFGTSVILDAGLPAPSTSSETTATSDVTSSSPGSTTAGGVGSFPPTSPAVEPNFSATGRNPATTIPVGRAPAPVTTTGA